MSDITEIVERVLAGQSPGYFIFPNAAAFAAEELDPEEVAAELASMEKAGKVEREQVVIEFEEITGENDGTVTAKTVPGGYRLKSED